MADPIVCVLAPNYREAEHWAREVAGLTRDRFRYVRSEQDLRGIRGALIMIYEGSGGWQVQGWRAREMASYLVATGRASWYGNGSVTT